MLSKKELGKKINKQGRDAEQTFLDYALSKDNTILITKFQEVLGSRPCDFIWITKEETCLVEVKSTIQYGGNIKKHQLLWMKKLREDINCYYAFVIKGKVHMVDVNEVIESIRRGETKWDLKKEIE